MSIGPLKSGFLLTPFRPITAPRPGQLAGKKNRPKPLRLILEAPFSATDGSTTLGGTIYLSPVDIQFSPFPAGTKIQIVLVGTANTPGTLTFDGAFQPGGSGEFAVWSGVLSGRESGLRLSQIGYNTAPNSDSTQSLLRLDVMSGLDAVAAFGVGSACRYNGSYGIGGAPFAKADQYLNIGYTLLGNAATRHGSYSISYSDATTYGPAERGSYAALGFNTALTLSDSLGLIGVARFGFHSEQQTTQGFIFDASAKGGQLVYGRQPQISYGGPAFTPPRSHPNNVFRGVAIVSIG